MNETTTSTHGLKQMEPKTNDKFRKKNIYLEIPLIIFENMQMSMQNNMRSVYVYGRIESTYTRWSKWNVWNGKSTLAGNSICFFN